LLHSYLEREGAALEFGCISLYDLNCSNNCIIFDVDYESSEF
jgi:hypothetical protein